MGSRTIRFCDRCEYEADPRDLVPVNIEVHSEDGSRTTTEPVEFCLECLSEFVNELIRDGGLSARQVVDQRSVIGSECSEQRIMSSSGHG